MLVRGSMLIRCCKIAVGFEVELGSGEMCTTAQSHVSSCPGHLQAACSTFGVVAETLLCQCPTCGAASSVHQGVSRGSGSSVGSVNGLSAASRANAETLAASEAAAAAAWDLPP
jgi:hypothetical protein